MQQYSSMERRILEHLSLPQCQTRIRTSRTSQRTISAIISTKRSPLSLISVVILPLLLVLCCLTSPCLSFQDNESVPSPNNNPRTSSPPSPSPGIPSVQRTSPQKDCSLVEVSTCHDVSPPVKPAVSTYSQREISGFKCEDLNFCDDILGFEAILNLHRQLDDDANGDIDVSESNEFLRDELKYEHGAKDRQKAFHGNDKHITVTELWHTWKTSAVHNWTVEETAQWLTDSVELPKYRDKFIFYKISGIALPRLAVNQQLASLLGINNVIHRQKLALKATDVVLFGLPKPTTLVKDLVMLALLLFAIIVGWFALRQHRLSQDHIRKMTREIEALSTAEKQLENMQDELNRTKLEHETAYREKEHLQERLKEHENGSAKLDRRTSTHEDQRVMELEMKLYQTQDELKRIESAYRNNQWTPPRIVKELLQLTYEIEIKNYNAKKIRAEAQLREAREECDKLRKKRSTMLGAFRVAHGSSIDAIDATILQARTMMTEVTKETHERIQRWKLLEQYCGFEITNNPGFNSLERTLYNTSQSTFMLPHTQSSTTLKEDASQISDFSSNNNPRRVSIPHEEDGLSMRSPNCESLSQFKSISTTNVENLMLRSQPTAGIVSQHKPTDKLQRGASDGVEKHFYNSNDLSTKNGSFESEEFIHSSSSSESNATTTMNYGSSENGSAIIKEKKKKGLFSGFRRKKGN